MAWGCSLRPARPLEKRTGQGWTKVGGSGRLLLVLGVLLPVVMGLALGLPRVAGAEAVGLRVALGDPWTTQTVDSVGDVGSYTALALDVSGYPHISYYDATNRDLRYARWTGSEWTSEAVDSAGAVGMYTSLVLDAADHPHISYCDSTNRDLKYARWTGSGWAAETVDSAGDIGMYTSLALDAAGHPHVAYCDSTNRDLKYAYWTGAQWAIQTVDSAGDVGLMASLSLDGGGNPHISYYDDTSDDLKYARWMGDRWAIETVDGGRAQAGLYSAVKVDAAGHAHISYCELYWPNVNPEPTTYLKYARWTGAAWSLQNVELIQPGHAPKHTSLALDAAGDPHIAYFRYLGSGQGSLKYAHWTGSSWTLEVVDDAGYAGEYCSLALDAAGSPHVSYYARVSGDLRYARKGQVTPVPVLVGVHLPLVQR